MIVVDMEYRIRMTWTWKETKYILSFYQRRSNSNFKMQNITKQNNKKSFIEILIFQWLLFRKDANAVLICARNQCYYTKKKTVVYVYFLPKVKIFNILSNFFVCRFVSFAYSEMKWVFDYYYYYYSCFQCNQMFRYFAYSYKANWNRTQLKWERSRLPKVLSIVFFIFVKIVWYSKSWTNWAKDIVTDWRIFKLIVEHFDSLELKTKM